MNAVEQVFPPGERIALNNLGELDALEGLLPEVLAPGMTTGRRSWEARPRAFLTTKGFNGRLVNISLEVIENPYEALTTLDEKLQNPAGGAHYLRSDPNSLSMLGFNFSADGHSTGKGVIGVWHTKLWYLAEPPHDRVNARAYSFGEVLRRVATRPKLERGTRLDLQDRVQAIGLTVVRQRIAHIKPDEA